MRLVVHWIIVALIVVAAAWDLRTREVPDWIPLAILAWQLWRCSLVGAKSDGLAWWSDSFSAS